MQITPLINYGATPVNNLRWQMSVLRQSNISSTLNWRRNDVRLTSADVDCLLGRDEKVTWHNL